MSRRVVLVLCTALLASGCFEPARPADADGEQPEFQPEGTAEEMGPPEAECGTPRSGPLAAEDVVELRNGTVVALKIGAPGSGSLRLVPCEPLTLAIALGGVPAQADLPPDGLMVAILRPEGVVPDGLGTVRAFWGAPRPAPASLPGPSGGIGAASAGVEPMAVRADGPYRLRLATTVQGLEVSIAMLGEENGTELPSRIWQLDPAQTPVPRPWDPLDAVTDEGRVPPDTRRVQWRAEEPQSSAGLLLARAWRVYTSPDTQAGLYWDYLTVGTRPLGSEEFQERELAEEGRQLPGGTLGERYGHFVEDAVFLGGPGDVLVARRYYETMAGLPTAELGLASLFVPDPVE